MHNFLKTLYQDHRNLAKLLDVFDREVAVFEDAGDPNYDILETSLEYCSEYMDAVHHRKEEQMLEQLRKQDPETAAQADALSDQHHQLEHLTNEVSGLFAAIHDDAFGKREDLVVPAKRWSKAYREHLRWEEDVLFKVARQLFSKADWDAAQKRWQDEVNPLHDKAKDNRFSQLAAAIAEAADS